MTRDDLKRVMGSLTEKAAIIATDPGEICVGFDQIKAASKHFFEGFTRESRTLSISFKIGGMRADVDWLMASGNGNWKKDGKISPFP
jgi:hypothetical protein